MELKIHDFQISILRELLFKPGARFRDLKKVDVTNDHFSFHINHLLKEKLIEKIDSKYFLTTAGKEFANRMDTDAMKLEKQAKLAIAIHAVREINGQKEYLIHKRLKEPFFGWYGSQSGKIRWGENPLETAKREFLEETGLTGDFSLKKIVHDLVFDKKNNLLEDKYFWVFRVNNIKGKLLEIVTGGENIWMTEKEFKKLKNVFADFDSMHKAIESNDLTYEDNSTTVESF